MIDFAIMKGNIHLVKGYSVINYLQKGIYVDLQKKTVRIEPGVIGRELDFELNNFAYATTVGTHSDTGVSGLVLHGGFGWIGTKYGWSVDNIVSVDMV